MPSPRHLRLQLWLRLRLRLYHLRDAGRGGRLDDDDKRPWEKPGQANMLCMTVRAHVYPHAIARRTAEASAARRTCLSTSKQRARRRCRLPCCGRRMTNTNAIVHISAFLWATCDENESEYILRVCPFRIKAQND